MDEEAWQTLLTWAPEVEKIGRPYGCEFSSHRYAEGILVSWGEPGRGLYHELDGPGRILYRVYKAGGARETWGRYQVGWVHCTQPTLAEVCKHLKKRGVKWTALDGALSLCSGAGGELALDEYLGRD